MLGRGLPNHEPSRGELTARVRGTFREMPGLRLSLSEATQMLGICSRTCDRLMDDLVRIGELRLVKNLYVLA